MDEELEVRLLRRIVERLDVLIELLEELIETSPTYTAPAGFSFKPD
jgi:hypothetical protein